MCRDLGVRIWNCPPGQRRQPPRRSTNSSSSSRDASMRHSVWQPDAHVPVPLQFHTLGRKHLGRAKALCDMLEQLRGRCVLDPAKHATERASRRHVAPIPNPTLRELPASGSRFATRHELKRGDSCRRRACPTRDPMQINLAHRHDGEAATRDFRHDTPIRLCDHCGSHWVPRQRQN
jgi:hypothetical protein